jgi:hypothetical protein
MLGFVPSASAWEVCRRVFTDPGLRLARNYQTLYSQPEGPQKDQYNFELMGLLGVLYDLVPDATTGKITAQENPKHFKETRKYLKKRLATAQPEPSKQFVADIESFFKAKKLSSGLVMITFSPDQAAQLDILTHRAYGLMVNRFFETYENLVGFSYRLAGLEENALSSSVQMMVETKVLREIEKRNMTYQLAFDPNVWMNLLRTLENDFRTVEQKPMGSKANHDATWRIIDGNEPLYPVAGVALSSSKKNPTAPIEIKRYFKNEFEDPLGMVGVSEKNDFRDRHEMLYEVFKALPAGQALEIHAHSVVHARAYIKLGFKKTEVLENPLYPGVAVYLLKATREEVMEKIQAILQGGSESATQ